MICIDYAYVLIRWWYIENLIDIGEIGGVEQRVWGIGYNQITGKYSTSQFKLVIMFLLYKLFISIAWLWNRKGRTNEMKGVKLENLWSYWHLWGIASFISICEGLPELWASVWNYQRDRHPWGIVRDIGIHEGLSEI